MRHYGLIGKSLGHSFSKEYFTQKFERELINAEYSLYPLTSINQLIELVAGDIKLSGLNVTIPYKQSVIPYLSALSSVASDVGAVNCIKVSENKLVGHNTDVEGIESTLDMLNIDKSAALILGSGGAAQAVAHVLRRRKIDYMVVSREPNRGDITYDNIDKETIESHKLIINTTPLGMYPDVLIAPNIDYSAIGGDHRIFDLVYNPSPTQFMQLCSAQGAEVIGGTHMLHVQAEASWRIWNE